MSTNGHARISSSEWLRHPFRSAEITSLASGVPAPHDAGEHAVRCRSDRERSVEVGGQRRANRMVGRRLGWFSRAARSVDRLCAEVEDLTMYAGEAWDRFHVLGRHPRRPRQRSWRGAADATKGQPVTATQARAEADAVAHRISSDGDAGSSVHLGSATRASKALAYGMLFVDALALFFVFSFLLNIDLASPEPVGLITAIAFALFAAGVQAKLAIELGRRLWAWRNSEHMQHGDDEFPPRALVAMVCGLLLFVISGAAAVAIFWRVYVEARLAEADALGVLVGFLLAGAALGAPWLIVSQQTYDGSVLTRRCAHLTSIVEWTSSEQHRARAKARRRLARALALRNTAERRMGAVIHRAGRFYEKPHQKILLSRWLRRVQLADTSVDTPESRCDHPVSALSIECGPDLRLLVNAIAQMDAAIARATGAAHGTRPHRVQPAGSSYSNSNRSAEART